PAHHQKGLLVARHYRTLYPKSVQLACPGAWAGTGFAPRSCVGSPSTACRGPARRVRPKKEADNVRNPLAIVPRLRHPHRRGTQLVAHSGLAHLDDGRGISESAGAPEAARPGGPGPVPGRLLRHGTPGGAGFLRLHLVARDGPRPG